MRKNKIITKIKNDIKSVSSQHRVLQKAKEIADFVIEKEDKYSKMSDIELKNLSYRMMDEIKDGSSLENYLIDGLAIAREMIWRTHKQKAYPVQIIGAVVAHFGDFAEMRTGEGKTLTLLLVSYVNALSCKGVHIVTVNEYLVERDMKFSEAALGKLGVTVGYVTSTMEPEEKKKMYACHITYVSNSELGFDYLRDNMVQDIEEKMQRPLNFAIVDEADSILVDEARTPLIIAGNPEEGIELYLEVDEFVKTLEPSDYVIHLESHAINLNDNGIKKTEEHFKMKNLYDIENSEVIHKIMNSLRANFIMEIGREYIVRKNPKKGIDEIALVDSFTGRVMDGRMYSAGLHQAIQAKERVEIEPENITVATITYQSFFRLYKKLAGLSGTAITEKMEFLNIYNMVVVPIPTNKPTIRVDQPDFIFGTKQLKWRYVVADIKRRHEIGQPILVGTVSVEDSELLHRLLDRVGIPHKILNAKNHALEAEIIKSAGQKGAVTIATNMAGRGTDIKLGEGVIELGGLFVLGTERNESRRIDNQLRGRAGRQGDPGESRFFISMQDSLFKRFAGDKFDRAQYNLGEEVIDLGFFSRLLDRTQKRVENMNYDIRKNLIDYDYVLSEQRELMYKQRNLILAHERIIEIISKMVPRVVDVLISLNKDQENINMVHVDNLIEDIREKLMIELDADASALKNMYNSDIFDVITKNIIYILEKKFSEHDIKIVNSVWKKIIISSLDRNWTKFLDRIQKLRDGVSLRSYEQKSPLNIYVEDSDRLFYNITITIAEEVISQILRTNIKVQQNQSPKNTSFRFMDSETLTPTTIQNTENSNYHSLDEIELSTKVAERENETRPAESVEKVILDDNEKEMNMSKDNNLKNNVDDVVDQILNNKNERNDAPPPIPSKVETKEEFNIDEIIKENKEKELKESKEVNENDFLKQVLDVVENDIQVEQFDIKDIEKEFNSDMIIDNTELAPAYDIEGNPVVSNNRNVPPPPPIKTTTNVTPPPIPSKEKDEIKSYEYSSPEQKSEFKHSGFTQDSEIQKDTYKSNFVKPVDNAQAIEAEKLNKQLEEARIAIAREKYEAMAKVKEEQINDLLNKNSLLERELENEKLNYHEKIEKIYSKENKELEIITENLGKLIEIKKQDQEKINEWEAKLIKEKEEQLRKEREILEEKLAEQKAIAEQREKEEQELAEKLAKIEEEKRIAEEQKKQRLMSIANGGQPKNLGNRSHPQNTIKLNNRIEQRKPLNLQQTVSNTNKPSRPQNDPRKPVSLSSFKK